MHFHQHVVLNAAPFFTVTRGEVENLACALESDGAARLAARVRAGEDVEISGMRLVVMDEHLFGAVSRATQARSETP